MIIIANFSTIIIFIFKSFFNRQITYFFYHYLVINTNANKMWLPSNQNVTIKVSSKWFSYFNEL